MFDSTLLRDQLEAVLEALERIPRRFLGISRAEVRKTIEDLS